LQLLTYVDIEFQIPIGRLMKRIIMFLLLGCIGVTTEIFFTAVNINIASEETNWALEGHSYIWMFPIYGSASLLFPILMRMVKNYHLALRLIAYGIGILLVEFIAGAILDLITGSCPWEYKTGLHLMGYIRFDYFPLWALFGYGLERIIKFLDNCIPEEIKI
jgi:uncharacterized membrane protein